MVSTSVDGLKAQQGWLEFSDKPYSFSDLLLVLELTTLHWGGKKKQPCFLVFLPVCI